MKKLVLVAVLLLTFTLAGCTEADPVVIIEREIVEVEIPTIVVETEIVEVDKVVVETVIEVIEVERIVIETEIKEIEIPVIVKEIIEVEVEVPVYIETEEVSTSLYQTGYSDVVIYVISKGSESYVMEFRYTDTLTTSPTFHFSQMEYQYDGEAVTSLFLEEIDGYEGTEVDDYYGFMEEVRYYTDDMTWSEIEEAFDFINNILNAIEIIADETVSFGNAINGTLSVEEYTYVLELELLVDTVVAIEVTTTQEIDINLYNSSLVFYEYDDYITFYEGTGTMFYTLPAGINLLEIENYYDYDNVEFTIIITLED